MDNFAYQWPYSRMTQPRECTVNFEPGQYGGDYLNYAYPNYHQGWEYPQDYSWSHNSQDQYYAPNPTYPPEFSCSPPLPQEEKPNMMDFLTKSIADQEEMLRSHEISTQNLNNQMALLINSSTGSLHIRDSETITENLSLEDHVSKFMASNDERLIEQEKSMQNLQNQLDHMFKALNNYPQNNWCHDMDSETDGEPEPNLQLDEPQEIEIEETIGDMVNTVGEQLYVHSNEDVPILLVPQVPSPPKFESPVRFAIPCPLGSHVIGQAFSDIKASASLETWFIEEEKIKEEPIVFDEFKCPNMVTNTMEEAPSYLTIEMGNLPTKSKLGDLDFVAITNGNLPNNELLPMDGGFLKYRRGIG